jgi:hypothetical protein
MNSNECNIRNSNIRNSKKIRFHTLTPLSAAFALITNSWLIASSDFWKIKKLIAHISY